MDYIRISEDRVGAVIGKRGAVKSKIEDALSVKLGVESEAGVVTIENTGDDPLGGWKARDVIKAISYGINLDTALKLKDDAFTLILINICDIVGRSKKAVTRQKARIIGRRGKTKEHISELTGTTISLKGKHIAIVGRLEDAALAQEAVESLASGMPHGVVYKVIEKKCSSMKFQRNVEMWNKK